jgi:hypothetical protein
MKGMGRSLARAPARAPCDVPSSFSPQGKATLHVPKVLVIAAP